VACGIPEVLEPHATRLHLAIMVHLPLSDETSLTAPAAAELNALERRTLHLATTVIATSTQAARRVEQLHDLSGVHAVPPGVDPAPLAVPSPEGNRFLTVASLTHRKGQDVLVAALKSLSAHSPATGPATPSPPAAGHWAANPPTASHLAASPPAAGWLGDRPPASGALEGGALPSGPAWACTLVGAGPAVPEAIPGVRLAGPLTGAALDSAYANADLFVLPSRAETYGMVVTEALARGLPVVASAVGGVPEALGSTDGGLPGRLLPPGDPDALAAALRDWLTDPALRERWRTAARTRRESLTGWDETARQLAEILSPAG
jgi:glycosyltransferase involved in cell wall biosynthesis